MPTRRTSPPRAQVRHYTTQLIDDECAEARADGHYFTAIAELLTNASRLPSGSQDGTLIVP